MKSFPLDSFRLHPQLEKKIFVWDFPLSLLFLENEKNYPWWILVPRRPGASRLMDLSIEDQHQLCIESTFIQKYLWTQFCPTQINVAAIGNKTPQLHLHVIARFEGDPAWPGTVWDHSVREPYEQQEIEREKERFKNYYRSSI